MNKELFGVFDGRDRFERLAGERNFDAVVGGSNLTVGLRDTDLGRHGRSDVYETDRGVAAVWGEAFPPDDVSRSTAEWLYDSVGRVGKAALDDLNGSYVAAVDTGDEAFVATDPVRSWECFYADAAGERVFGSDAATVAATIPYPGLRNRGLAEFLHLGVVLGTGTTLESLHRVPFDGLLRADDVETLDRFVYEPREFDYVAELADRLQRAIDRRDGRNRRTGLMLSAGYDSRTFLPTVGDVDRSYTVGEASSPEVRNAGRLATQYDTPHTTFPPDGRYITPDDRKVRYSQGVKESLHVHHGGFEDYLDCDVVYHGLWYDTLFRGYFKPEDTVDVLGYDLPLNRPETDPDPVEALLKKFPYAPEASEQLVEELTFGPDDPDAFVHEALHEEVEAHADRAASVHDAIAVTGIANQPAVPFRTHLADNHCESFMAVDRELLDWHCTAPPEARTLSTFVEVCRRLDDGLLRHRPPDRRFDSRPLNAVDNFARRNLPWLESPGTPWPDRDTLFRRYGVDDELFPWNPGVKALPPRHKLRINDVRGWLSQAVDVEVTPDELLGTPASD